MCVFDRLMRRPSLIVPGWIEWALALDVPDQPPQPAADEWPSVPPCRICGQVNRCKPKDVVAIVQGKVEANCGYCEAPFGKTLRESPLGREVARRMESP